LSTEKASQPDDPALLIGHGHKPPAIRLEPGIRLRIYRGIVAHDGLGILRGMETSTRLGRLHSSSPSAGDRVHDLESSPRTYPEGTDRPRLPGEQSGRERSDRILLPLEE
jgi:hypothetical protein